MISRRSLLTALPLLAGCGKSGSGYHGFAYVAAAGSRSVAVVDLLAFSARERIPLDASPISLTRTEKRLYAVLPEAHALAEIDTAARKVARRIPLPGPPAMARPDDAGAKVWCLVSDARPALVPIHAETGKAAAPIPLAGTPLSFALSPVKPEAAVTLESGAVQFVDLSASRALPPVELAPGLGSLRYRSDGQVLLVAERGRRLVTILDTVSRRVIAELPLALSPDHLTMKEDGGQLFITGEGLDAVVIVYPYRTEVAQTSLSGRHPGRMAVSTDPPYLFVANPEAGSVSVFDIVTQKVVAVTGVGARPGAITVTPDQQYALVLNEGSGDMAVIRISAISPGREKRAPLFTMIPIGEQPLDLRVVPA